MILKRLFSWFKLLFYNFFGNQIWEKFYDFSLLLFCNIYGSIPLWTCRPEINIKPWNSLRKELEEGNNRTKWMDREPYAYWKGNIRTSGNRQALFKCRPSNNHDWNARVYDMVITCYSTTIIFHILIRIW